MALAWQVGVSGTDGAPLRLECCSQVEREALRWPRLQALLGRAWETSPYYRAKFAAAGLQHPGEIGSAADLHRLGLTTREEIAADQAAHPPWGTLGTGAPEEYVAVHRSGGHRHLYWYDDAQSWAWVQGLWDYVFRAAGVVPGDRAFFAFAFAPVLWYWAGFERAQESGLLALTGGAMTPLQRVQNLFDLKASVLVTTPEEGLQLAEVAEQHGYHPAKSPLRTILYAGRPGDDPRAVGQRLEAAWGAESFCVTWLTEAGITGFECPSHPGGVHLLESEIYCEVIDPVTGQPLPPGEEGELVVTPLGRLAMPVIRYRTGDRVRLAEAPCACGRTLHWLTGGIRGRVGAGGEPA